MTCARISAADIQSVFSVFDTDCTGIIDAQELLHAMKSLGWSRVTESDISHMLAGLGKDSRAGEGLNEEEFATLVRDKQKLADGPEEIHAAFRLFDTTSQGKLSAADLKDAGLRATGKNVPDKLVEEILRLADTDKDGYLSFDEFRRAVSVAEGGNLADNMQQSVHFAFGGTMSADQVASELAAEEAAAGGSADGSPSKSGDAESGETELIAGVKVHFVGKKIAKDEVRRALVVLGYDDATLPQSVFDDLFADSDADADSQLTLDEYCTLLVGFGEQVDGY